MRHYAIIEQKTHDEIVEIVLLAFDNKKERDVYVISRNCAKPVKRRELSAGDLNSLKCRGTMPFRGPIGVRIFR